MALLHQPLTGIKTLRLRWVQQLHSDGALKAIPCLDPLQCPSVSGLQQGSRDALALSALHSRLPHHLCDCGFLTYSETSIQVQNIFTTFQSRWNLCKSMCTTT